MTARINFKLNSCYNLGMGVGRPKLAWVMLLPLQVPTLISLDCRLNLLRARGGREPLTGEALLVREIRKAGLDLTFPLRDRKLTPLEAKRIVKSSHEIISKPKVFEKHLQEFSSPLDLLKSAENYWAGSQKNASDQKPKQIFSEIYGFQPEKENFLQLRKIALDFEQRRPLVGRFHFDKFEVMPAPRPSSTTSPLAQAAAIGIRKLWNDPARMVDYMTKISNQVEGISRREGIPRAAALEKFRLDMEKKAGFGPTQALSDLVSSQKWNSVLASQQPTQDISGNHSFEKTAGFGQNVHRDQWLLITMDIGAHPENYPMGSAAEMYAAFGTGLRPGANGIDESSLWFQLFDEFTGARPIPANPFYFHELWKKATGFGSAW